MMQGTCRPQNCHSNPTVFVLLANNMELQNVNCNIRAYELKFCLRVECRYYNYGYVLQVADIDGRIYRYEVAERCPCCGRY